MKTIQLEILFVDLDKQTQTREAKKRIKEYKQKKRRKYAKQREYINNPIYESVHINGKEVYLK